MLVGRKRLSQKVCLMLQEVDKRWNQLTLVLCFNAIVNSINGLSSIARRNAYNSRDFSSLASVFSRLMLVSNKFVNVTKHVGPA